MKIYKDEFSTEQKLLDEVERARTIHEEWKTTIGIPAPLIHPKIKKIIEGEDFELVDYNEDEETRILENIEGKKLQEIYLVEKLEAQTIPSKKYGQFRASEYPELIDYIDGVVKGDQEQIDAYISKCQAIKEKYPKPE